MALSVADFVVRFELACIRFGAVFHRTHEEARESAGNTPRTRPPALEVLRLMN